MPRKLRTKEILENNLNREHPKTHQIVIWAHNIRSLHNIGAIFRSCDAFGIDELLLSGFSPKPDRPEVNKTAIGAEEYVKWSYYADWMDALKYVKKSNFELLGLEQTSDSIALPDYKLPVDKGLCILLGNEVTGIEDDIIPHLETCLEIPQYGHKHSLNVSVAAGVLMYDLINKLWTQKKS